MENELSEEAKALLVRAVKLSTYHLSDKELPYADELDNAGLTKPHDSIILLELNADGIAIAKALYECFGA